MTSLTEFLLARLAEDEVWANGCEGLHWEWRDNDTDELVQPDPLVMEYVDEDRRASLRSVEQFPYESIPGEGPRFVIHDVEEANAAAAGHIARHDPARVLAQVEALRAVVSLHVELIWYGGKATGKCETCAENDAADYDGAPMVAWPCPTLRILASVYSDHPDFRAEWSPDYKVAEPVVRRFDIKPTDFTL